MVTAGYILIGLGVLAFAALPKVDRRYRTGYKNNQVPDGRVILFGIGSLALGGGLVWVDSSINSSRNEILSAQQDNSQKPEPVNALQRCLVEANNCSETSALARCFERADVQAEATQTCQIDVVGATAKIGTPDVCRGMRRPLACCGAYNLA